MADNPEDELFQAPVPESRVKTGDVAHGVAALGVGFAPGAGVAEILGQMPDPFNPGQMLPSFSENIEKGEYVDAALQTLGGAGDALYVLGATAPLGAALKGAQALGKSLRGAKAVQKAPFQELNSNYTKDGVNDFYELMSEDGALYELSPKFNQYYEDWIYRSDRPALNRLLRLQDYKDYKETLRANLDRTFPGDKILVSRTEGFFNRADAVNTGRHSKRYFEIDKNDVLLAGHSGEKELVVKGPRGTPMSVSIQHPEKIFENVSDLTTPELVTSWVIAPNKVNRSDVARRLLSDETALAKTNQALDSMGYGDTVPVFRMVRLPEDVVYSGSYAEFWPESLVSATLDPQKVFSNIDFMTQGKFSPFENADYRLVRYDVPRSNIAGYLPAISGDINRNVNKAVKARGFGQEKIAGLSTVTNPAEHAKRLIGIQDEMIVDVTGIRPKVLLEKPDKKPMNVLSGGSVLPKFIAEGKIKSPEDMAAVLPNTTVLNYLKYIKQHSNVPFDVAEKEAREKAIREYQKFFGVQNKAEGGIAALPVDDKMINPEILAQIERIMGR
jgi:hypothetical protein